MKKKISKIFISTFIILSISIIVKSMYAREILDLQELGKQIENINSEAENAYIVGEYVFTSGIEFKMQDIMLGGSSIKVSDENKTNRDSMNIFAVSKNFKNNTWEIAANLVGNGKLEFNSPDNPVIIKYIDYEELKEAYTVTLDLNAGDDSTGDYPEKIRIDEGLIDASLITGDKAPTREGYVFKEWTKNDGSKWNFEEDTISSDITLKATWYKEVDTNELLTFAAKAINEKTKINGYFYDIDFKDKVITFNVFDLNKKSSEVLNTGLISSIVEIVNNENVVSMTISNGKEEGKITFEKNDVNNGSDENSNAWKRFAYMLCKLTGKECSDVNEALVAFKDITLGDLVKIEDDLKLTITLDNTKARSQDNNEKEEYTIKLSYNAKVTITKPDETEDFSGFNYTLQDSYDINGENGLYKVTKYITEQDGVTGFGTNPSKFYFAYTIELDNDIDISEAKVKIPVKENPGEKDYNESKFDDDRKVTVLMEVTEEDLEIENGKYRDIIIEIDGVPTRVRIDFSDLELRRNSKFTVEALPAIDKSEFPDDGWYDTDNGYSVNVKQDENDEKRYIVTGVLPIFDDESDESYDITFDTDKSLYYLGLLLKANNKVNNENTGKINVKFFHGNEEDNQFIEIPDSEFSSTGELYILKALCETFEDGGANEDRVFTITLDLDGKDSTKYEPYTVTIDWSGLILQDTSRGDFGNYDVITKKENLEEESPEYKELEKYGYNYNASSEVSIKMASQEEPEYYEYKNGLEGIIKEQTLEQGFLNNEGYFVPIKVEFPGNGDKRLDNYKNTWTIILNTESGEKKEYTPTEAEYKQGWVLVLFRIEREGKNYGDSGNQKIIKYQIDYDGTPGKGANQDKDTGFAFLPEEYSIDYSDLAFETENKITYKYKDNEGKNKEETVVAYENEKVTLKNMEDISTDYRKFDGWYGSEGKVENYVAKKDTDEILTAHWNLNVDKFMEDVIEDLNSDTTIYSDKFEGFELSKVDNDITINIKKANEPLTDIAKTSVPGTIAYLLEKGEIKDISLTVDGNSASEKYTIDYTADGENTYEENDERKFLSDKGKALKKEIIKGAKDAFDEKSIDEENATLDQLEYEGKSFTIKIGDIDSTVKLVDNEGNDLAADKKTYTFKFDSDFVVVNQTPKSNLGAKKISDAIENENSYTTVYIDDSDYSEDSTIDIIAKTEVNIKPVDNSKDTTITAKGDYALDVQSGTVTISDLKLTGGKKAELKIEEGANVTVNNIDVSGITSPEEAKNKGINAGIIVEGNLTGATNVVNLNESYNIPTISVINSYAFPGEIAGENEDKAGKGETAAQSDFKTTGSARNVAGMTKNRSYYVVDRTNNDFNTTTERYYGAFYYTNPNNSQLYFMGVFDTTKKDHPYDYIQIYYYNEEIDIKKIGYEVDKTPEYEDSGTVFKCFRIGNTTSGKMVVGGELAQNVLIPHDTNVAYAIYGQKPQSTLEFEKISGLESNGNKISGTLKTQSEGKFNIPVTITSEKFVDNVSTVIVTNPNEEEKTYTYGVGSENEIVTVIDEKTIKLNLEAIKNSKITGDSGKVYEISVDVDGEVGKIQPDIYKIDYNELETLEEVINKAAEKTQNAKNLTITRDNDIKSVISKDTTMYDKETGRRLVKVTNGDGESYTFNKKEVDANASETTKVNVEKNMETSVSNPVYLKGGSWRFNSTFSRIGYGVFELELLKDVIYEKAVDNIYAINTVEETSDNTYKITINKAKFDNWINTNYNDFESLKELEKKYTLDGSETVELEVTIKDGYITSMICADFSIKGENDDYTKNKINLQISNVGTTEVGGPLEVLKEGTEELTLKDIADFVKAGQDWWNSHI